MEILLGIFLLLIYFAPAISAAQRKHPNTAAITCLNLFLGWTGIGWIIALIWSYTNNTNNVVVNNRINSGGTAIGSAQEIERLADLYAKGFITESEFEMQKRKLLGFYSDID